MKRITLYLFNIVICLAVFAQKQTPTITSAPNSIDVLTFVSDGTNMLGIATQDFG